jgi:hypothetical protein
VSEAHQNTPIPPDRQPEQDIDRQTQTRAVETLSFALPLATRITFAEMSNSSPSWMRAGQLAEAVGKYDRWVYRMVNELGIPSQERMIDGQVAAVYPPFTLGILQEELSWREAFRSLPPHLSLTAIAEYTGRSRDWTRKTLGEIGAEPIKQTRGGGVYRKGVLKSLRRINMAVPLDDGWQTIGQLLEYGDFDRPSLIRLLADAGLGPERRRSTLTGRVGDHYPPDSLSIIKNGGRPRIVNSLILSTEQQRQWPLAEDYLRAGTLGRALGRSGKWVLRATAALDIKPEKRRDDVGRVRDDYFSPSTLDRLREYEAPLLRARPVTPEDVTEIMLIVGSLRARIKARQGMLAALRAVGAVEDNDQAQTLTTELTTLKQKLRRAELRHERATMRLEGSVS